MKYPNPCTRCGMCCLSEPCFIVKQLRKDNPTPFKVCSYLSFNENEACCELVQRGLVPVGDGCCIKARAYRDGVKYDYASLSKELKIKAVRQIRSK